MKETASSQGNCSWCFKWPYENIKSIAIVLLSILVITLIVIWWLAPNKPAASKSATSPYSLYINPCPKNWIGYEGKCYNFSSTEGTWDDSQRQCALHGASLASIDNKQDMEFMMRCKNRTDHWIGLRRKDEGHPWKWTNGSVFNNWFNIRAKGFCAYLNDKEASSTECDRRRNWICTKPFHIFHWDELLSLSTNTSSLDSGYQLMKMNCSVPES